MSRCLIGLGSNVGDRAAQLDFAVRRLRETPGIELLAQSRWIETKPIGGPSGQSLYLNGAALIKTSIKPEALLDVLQRIENEAGRHRGAQWGPRTLDLDLLLYGERKIKTPRLTVPHPRMAFRRFVLEPAAEIAGNLRHATTGWKVHWLWRHLIDARRTVALGGPPSEDKQRLAAVLCKEIPATLVVGDEGEFVARLAQSSPVRARDVALEFIQRWRALPSISDTRVVHAAWRVRDFAIADAAALVPASWGDAARFCDWELHIFGDAMGVPRLTLVVQPGAPSESDLAVVADVARLTEGPMLVVDASDRDTAVSEAIAAVRAAE